MKKRTGYSDFPYSIRIISHSMSNEKNHDQNQKIYIQLERINILFVITNTKGINILIINRHWIMNYSWIFFC